MVDIVATLPDLLRAVAAGAPDAPLIHVAAGGEERVNSYSTLLTTAEEVAKGLADTGLAAGQLLLLALEDGADFLSGFWGALLAGLVPVPLALDPERITAIWHALGRPAALLPADLGPLLDTDSLALTGEWSAPVRCIRAAPGATSSPKDDGLAYIQFSSGSTGAPRGVALSHAAVLANIRQMQEASTLGPEDCVVSWMPYYHDMGLVTGHLLPLATGIKQVKIDQFAFARRPGLWLETAHRHQATILSAAPFALSLVLRRVPQVRIKDLDLTQVRLLGLGAEPISPAICRDFLALLAPTGFDPQSLLPVYGLAEACVGVTLPPLGSGMTTVLLDRAALVQGQAQAAQGPFDPATMVELADVGAPIPDTQVRIVDDGDQPLPAGVIGHVQVAGPQVMRGYLGAPDQAAFCGHWLRTGDLGFLRQGRLIITGRAKEVIIVNGQKYHAPDLEDMVRDLAGSALRRVAVCGAVRNGGAEHVVVFLALTTATIDDALAQSITRRLRQATGAATVAIVPMAARDFPRTSSGKLRRTLLRARYEEGAFDTRITPTPQAARPKPAASSPHSRLPDNLEAEIINLCAQVLQIESQQIRAETPILDLGPTSLQLMDLLAAIGDTFGYEPDPAALRMHPSPQNLATWLRTQAAHHTTTPTTPAPAALEPVAIISMACRLPDAATPEEFWANLVAGRDSVAPLPALRADGIPAPAPAQAAWGSLLGSVSRFDAGFFRITPAEAALMDPQQRLLLELAYEALERAGYAGSRRKARRIGVFVGVGEATYQQLIAPLLDEADKLHPATATGAMRSLIAGRIANALDLTGPAIAIDTACSSTLVALHLARTSLLQGECDLALVGGVSLNLTAAPFTLLGQAGALSPGGRCRPFDDSADGIAIGEGAGMLLLAAHSHAKRHNDPVLALVRGSAINNDGHALSPMAPNPLRQAEALRLAYASAGIDPASVSYIESHGTGTALGDPVELRSLAQVFPADGQRRLIGSVKSNLGHLLNAAGIPALIKTLLMLQHGSILPSLNYVNMNHRFDAAQAGLAVATKLEVWAGPRPLRAGVNGFGFGGTNAHVILEEAPQQAQQPEAQPAYVLGLAAHTPDALHRLCARYAAHLRANPALDPAAVCAGAAEREALAYRMAFVSGGLEQQPVDALADLAAQLSVVASSPASRQGYERLVQAARPRKVALLFSGQGSQYPRQGARLYQHEATFQAALDEASRHLGPLGGRTLVEWCLAEDVEPADLAQTTVTQPLLVAFEVALARTLIAHGLTPAAVVGHSVGEIAAACVAGFITFAEALDFARARGQIMAEHATPGMMAAIFAPAAMVRETLAEQSLQVTIAAINTPSQVVIAGPRSAVETALETLTNSGISGVIVNHDHAYHSPLMEPALALIAQNAARLGPQDPHIPFYSTASGAWLSALKDLDADYWAQQAMLPVLFADALEQLYAAGFEAFVEVGPGSTLAAFARQMLAGRDDTIAIESLLRRGHDDCVALYGALGRLWAHGALPEIQALNDYVGPRVALPTYPFADERHWVAAPTPHQASLTLRPQTIQAPFIAGQAIAEVALEPEEHGYHLRLKDATGQVLYEITGLQPTAASTLPQTKVCPASKQPLQETAEQISVQLPASPNGRAQAVRTQPEAAPMYAAPDGSLPGAVLQQVIWSAASLPPETKTPLQEWLIVPDAAGTLAAALGVALEERGLRWRLFAATEPVPAQPYGVVVLAEHGQAPTIADHANLMASQEQGVLRLLALIQGLLALPQQERPAGLWVVTAGAHVLDEDSDAVPLRALSVGLMSALADQAPGFAALALDFGLDAPQSALIEALMRELLAEPVSAIVAWRGAKRLGRGLAPLPADTPPSAPPQALDIVAIIGGMGGVGTHLARHLARRYRSRLLIIGRGALDPRRTALLAELRDLGADPAYRQLDIADPHQAKGLAAELAAAGSFGIVQAAGELDVASLQAKDAARFAAVLAPKVSGTWGLAKALTDHGAQATFFVVCSSVAALVPGLSGGIADYVAANAFLDAFAASERRAGRPMLALNWSAWTGVGFAALPLLGERLRDRGVAPLEPVAALQAFDQALGLTQAQIAILGSGAPSALRPAAPQLPTVATNDAKAIGTIALLQELIGKALRRPAATIPPEAPFLTLGLESLQAVDLVKSLERTTGRTLPLTLFFEYQTIREVAEYLERTPLQQPQGVPQPRPVSMVEPFAMAPAQVALYVGQQLYPERSAFALVRQTIGGTLDPALLQLALEALVARHPQLRAQVLTAADGVPLQEILPAERLPAATWFELWRDDADLEALEQALLAHRFDLHKAPLFRAVLCKATTSWTLFLLVHHCVADGWSMSILVRELWEIYTALSFGQQPQLAPLSCTYADYAQARRDLAASQQAEADRAWWAEHLHRHRAALERGLPQGLGTGTGLGQVRQVLDAATTAKLRQTAAELEVSLFHMALATYARVLSDWSGHPAIVINVAEHGRSLRLPGVEELVGCCADHLPLVLELGPEEEISALAQRVRAAWTETIRHSLVSAPELARLGGVRRSDGLRALGTAALSMARFPGALPAGCPITVEALQACTATPATQLSLLIWEFADALHCAWIYAQERFAPGDIEQLAAAYQHTLGALAQQPAAEKPGDKPGAGALHARRMRRPAPGRRPKETQPTPNQRLHIAPAEKAGDKPGAGALHARRMRRPAPRQRPKQPQPTRNHRLHIAPAETRSLAVAERIATYARLEPRRVAVRAAEGALTYGELAAAATAIGALLRAPGADRPVALLARPGLAAVAGMVGALWAGVPWLPLSAEYPAAHLRELMREADAELVLYEPGTRTLAEELAAPEQRHCLTEAMVAAAEWTEPATVNPDLYAYIMFTSGSTGRPKAVPIMRRALEAYLGWLVTTFGYGTGDRLMQTAALSFDAALSQILGPLAAGGSVSVLEREVVRDPVALLEVLERERPTIWRSVPALWEQLLVAIEGRVAAGEAPPRLEELRIIGLGGAALPTSVVRRWQALYGQRQRIVNHYGPTEATINATWHEVRGAPNAAEATIPIGRPLPGVIARVLDAQGRPCAPGEIGELALGGVCLTPGYLGRADLTAERFRPDPRGTGARLYHTGDLVRALPGGELVFLGRSDEQLNLRGYRIEPAEIEAALVRHADIEAAAVALIGADEPLLVAYCAAPAGLPEERELRRWLGALLPPQMLPQRFMALEALPLTGSGKVDKRRLATLALPEASERTTHLASATERLVAETWGAVLRRGSLSREDDFFMLGGDSLALLRVLSLLEGRVARVPRAATLYARSTLADFAAAIDEATEAPPPQREDVASGAFPLTPIQRGFLLTETLDPAAATTWCARLAIDGPLNLEALEQALTTLSARHPMLRTAVLADERPPLQEEREVNRVSVRLIDLAPQIAAGACAEELQAAAWKAERERGFQLEQAPLLRLSVLRLGPERHVWLIAAHHIIGDGWSAWIFAQELLAAYDRLLAGAPLDLPPLRASFREYAALLAEQETQPEQARYWCETFAAPYQRPTLSQSGLAAPGARSITMPSGTLERLRSVATATGLTPYILVLAAFAQQLRRFTGSDDLVIGTAHSGRDHALPDIGRIVGCFAAALPVRSDLRELQGLDSARALLPHLAEAFRAAYRHALPPLEIARLLSISGSSASLAAVTGAQFFFTFLDFDALGPIESQTLTLDWSASHTEIHPPQGTTELLLAARVLNGALRLTLQGPEPILAPFGAALVAEIDDLLASIPANGGSSQADVLRVPAMVAREPAHSAEQAPARLDAALIGYLPPIATIAPLLGSGQEPGALREWLRGLLFPQGRPRWLETLTTPIGSSGLLCLPWFADELTPATAAGLGAEIAAALPLAAARGARCVSLAGMLPALTGYGFAVQRALAKHDRAALPALTTGHATTVVAVTQTISAALAAAGQALETCDVAFVGLGSIGSTALEVMLRTQPQPRSLILCDIASQAERLTELAAGLRTRTGYRGAIELAIAAGTAPRAVYGARVIVAATSAPGVIDVAQLAPGTILIDDSFPPCLDTGAAIERMQHYGDVLIVGGGMLACGPSARTIEVPLGDEALRERIVAELVPGAAASCQLEALLWAADPTLPLTEGLASVQAALRYREAAHQAGFGAAPLHLRTFIISDIQLPALS